MAEKLIIDNRTGKGTEYLLAHLGAVLMLGTEELGDEKAVLFDDGVTIHMIKNERSVRYLVLQGAPLEVTDGHADQSAG